LANVRLLTFLKKHNRKRLPSDIVFMDKTGEYAVAEVKYQAIFKPHPFYGHGLPDYQVKARLDFDYPLCPLLRPLWTHYWTK